MIGYKVLDNVQDEDYVGKSINWASPVKYKAGEKPAQLKGQHCLFLHI